MKCYGSSLIVTKYKHVSNLLCSRNRFDTKQMVAFFSSSQLSNRKQLWRWFNYVKGYHCPLVQV